MVQANIVSGLGRAGLLAAFIAVMAGLVPAIRVGPLRGCPIASV